MKRIATLMAACAAVVVMTTGCAGLGFQAPVVPGLGWLYSDFKAPLDIDASGTSLGSKEGKASVMNVLGIVAIGDASMANAAKQGGITTVYHADYRYTNILGIIATYETIAYGE